MTVFLRKLCHCSRALKRPCRLETPSRHSLPLDDRRLFFFLRPASHPLAVRVEGILRFSTGSIGLFLKPRTRWFVRPCLLVAHSVPRTRCALLVLVRRRLRYWARRSQRSCRGLHGRVLPQRGKFFGNLSLPVSSTVGVTARRPAHRSEVFSSGPICSFILLPCPVCL